MSWIVNHWWIVLLAVWKILDSANGLLPPAWEDKRSKWAIFLNRIALSRRGTLQWPTQDAPAVMAHVPPANPEVRPIGEVKP